VYKIIDGYSNIIAEFNDLTTAEIQLCYYVNHGEDYYLQYEL